MTESLFSPSWYRVAQLKPRLRGHTRIYRHEYRGEVWYVLQDHAKGRYHRFNPASYQILGQMNGQRTVEELWEFATERLGDEGLSQGDVVRLLGQLHAADVLLCDVPPDTAELLRRWEKVERTKWSQKLRNPLAIRFSLIDPDKFLSRTIGLVRPLFGFFGALLWLCIVGSAIVLAGLHWPELTRNLVDRVLALDNLVLIALAYPVVKALHELGHGYAVKAWGGEVHDMGIMFLVFMPVPYVDASAASEFRARYRRVLVGAAGILVELFLASVALYVWLGLEPGRLRSVAYNVILIGSVSAVLFNGNPLLRYDGYYILADLLEIPNLAQRGTRYISFLVKRYAFGLKDTPTPHLARGERFWFVFYSVAAFIYRVFIYIAIFLFIAGKFFIIGILLAIWAILNRLGLPLLKGVKFLLMNPVLQRKRPRAVALSLLAVLILAVLLFVVPFPHRTRTEGVVWVPDEALVRAASDGFVTRVVAEPNSLVDPGRLLVELRAPLLVAKVEVLRARLEELESRHGEALAEDLVRERIIKTELVNARAELARAEERVADLEIRSPSAGIFIVPNAGDLPDRFFRQGELIGFVLDVERPTVRVVVPQSAVDLVRRRTRRVEARLAERLERVVPATIRREVPEAEERLPSTILGSLGGGAFSIDPTAEGGTKTFEKLFQFEIELAEPVDRVLIGGRVHVLFDHGFEPIGFQVYRGARQLFLRRFNV